MLGNRTANPITTATPNKAQAAIGVIHAGVGKIKQANAVSPMTAIMKLIDTKLVIRAATPGPNPPSMRHRAKVPVIRPNPSVWAMAIAVIPLLRATSGGNPVSSWRCAMTSYWPTAQKLTNVQIPAKTH